MSRHNTPGIHSAIRNLTVKGLGLFSQGLVAMHNSFNAAKPHLVNSGHETGEALWSFGDTIKHSTSVLVHTAGAFQAVAHGAVDMLQQTIPEAMTGMGSTVNGISSVANGDFAASGGHFLSAGMNFMGAGLSLLTGTSSMVKNTGGELYGASKAAYNTVDSATYCTANSCFAVYDAGLAGYSAVSGGTQPLYEGSFITGEVDGWDIIGADEVAGDLWEII